MSVLAQHIAALILHWISEQQELTASIYQSDIREIVQDRFTVNCDEELVDASLVVLLEIGALRRLKSPYTSDLLKISYDDAKYYFGNTPSPLFQDSSGHEKLRTYWKKRDFLREQYPILETYFQADEKWLELVIKHLKAESEEAALGNSHILADTQAPAANRVVSLDHNKPEYLEIKSGLSDIKVDEITHGYNGSDFDEQEKSRLSKALDSARILWEALQLSSMQIKVGIILVLEDLRRFVVDTAKQAAITLLADKILSFTGLDIRK